MADPLVYNSFFTGGRVGIKEKNQEKILRMLNCHGSLSVGAVMKALQLSEASVRRYFADMERAGVLHRYHGGVRAAVEKGGSGYQFNEASSSFTAEKHLIGQKAASLISDHDRLFFDSGTTVLECGNALAERLSAGELKDLRIVTNSLAFASGVTPFCPVVLTGGMIRLSRMDLCGSVALDNIRRYNFTRAILGTDAISITGELSTTDEETAALAAWLLEHSGETFILADSSKLGKSSFVPYGTLKRNNTTLITDHLADEAFLDKLCRQGIKVIVAEAVNDTK